MVQTAFITCNQTSAYNTMDAEKYINFKTAEDFILDKAFVSWVLHPESENSPFWESFITDYPEKETYIRDAAFIIRSLQPIEPDVHQEQLDKILIRISNRDRQKKYALRQWLRYAAGIAVLTAIGGLIWLAVNTKNKFPLEVVNNPVLKGKIILANGLVHEFDSEQTTIKQSATGNLTINSDTIKNLPTEKTLEMNQIIIPYGQRSDITLSDGTHIWLNSGSQLSYPTEFSGKTREVLLSGEAFFDVKPNPDKPFFVTTRELKIRVLGTSFNVSAYDEDVTAQTILVTGKVTAGKNNLLAQTIELAPGERLTYEKSKGSISKDKVDVRLYASWVNGYLIIENMPITEVLRKVQRYYNQDISTGEGLERITFSGKLDLKDDISEVLANISFASSVTVKVDNGTFNVIK